MQDTSSMPVPRLQKLVELLGVYSVTPTSEVDVNTRALREKVIASREFMEVEREMLLRALDWCTRQQTRVAKLEVPCTLPTPSS